MSALIARLSSCRQWQSGCLLIGIKNGLEGKRASSTSRIIDDVVDVSLNSCQPGSKLKFEGGNFG